MASPRIKRRRISIPLACFRVAGTVYSTSWWAFGQALPKLEFKTASVTASGREYREYKGYAIASLQAESSLVAFAWSRVPR